MHHIKSYLFFKDDNFGSLIDGNLFHAAINRLSLDLSNYALKSFVNRFITS